MSRRLLTWVGIASGVVLLAGAVAFLVVRGAGGSDRSSDTIPASRSWTSYRDPKMGWSLRYPSSWHRQAFITTGFEINARGLIVANLDRDFQHPDCGHGCMTTAWDFRAVPPGFVGMELTLWDFGAYRLPTNKHDTTFPLSWHDSRPHGNRYGPAARQFPIISNGHRYLLNIYLGRGVSPSDMQVARRIVKSLTKPTLGR
jgi:hypothetical protein